MSEKYLRFQQALLPEQLEKMISEELSSTSGEIVDFKFSAPDSSGLFRVDLTDQILKPFTEVGIIEVVAVEDRVFSQDNWNDVRATYILENGEDIEDVF